MTLHILDLSNTWNPSQDTYFKDTIYRYFGHRKHTLSKIISVQILNLVCTDIIWLLLLLYILLPSTKNISLWIGQWHLKHTTYIISHYTITKKPIIKFCQAVPLQYVYHYLPSTCEGSESLRAPTRLGSVRSSIIRLSSSKSSSSTSLIPETIRI